MKQHLKSNSNPSFFGLYKTFNLRKITVIFLFIFLCGGCTKVMELSDETKLTDFIIKSVTPGDIQLGKPSIVGDTVKIPVLRGITRFPMTVDAEPVFSSETEEAVPGTSFSSFNDIKFDLNDIHFNTFYLVAKSGLPRPYCITLDIDSQESKNDFKQFEITDFPSNSVIATKGFVNPIERTVDLYGIDVRFPLTIMATATLSDSAYIKEAQNVLDEKSLQLSFAGYGSNVEYSVEAENGAVRQWKVFLKQATETKGAETSDILSAVALDAKKQSAEVKSEGYTIREISADNKAGNLFLILSSTAGGRNIEIAATLTTRPNSQIVGYRSGDNILFEDYNSTKDFTVLDSRTGYYKRWKFVLVEGDVSDIYSFPFTCSSRNNYITIDGDATVIDNINKQIKLQVTRAGTPYYWPLTVTAGEVTCSAGMRVEIEPLRFDNMNDSAQFSLVSALGAESQWTVTLMPPLSDLANIDSVAILSSSYRDLIDSDVPVSTNTAEVFIDVKSKDVFPIRLQPHLYISEGAEFDSFQNGDFIEFESFDDVVEVGITSSSGQKKTWKIRLLEKTQLYNSDFELWVTSGVPTIDPIPGKGRGWATANNAMVRGTAPIANGANGYAAEMTTKIISLPKNLITSATLFLGYFDMTTISLDQPRTMTKFGVPFEARPIAFKIDAKYTPGNRYQRSRLVSGSGVAAKYELDDLQGGDRGQIYAELIHWNGEGKLNYSGEPTAGVYLLARGEYVLSGATDWSRLYIPLERKPEYERYQPTHLVVIAASSIDGHLFTGAEGSKLTIDNFELIY